MSAYRRMVKRYGVKAAASAGFLLLDKLDASTREHAVDEANGIHGKPLEVYASDTINQKLEAQADGLRAEFRAMLQRLESRLKDRQAENSANGAKSA